MSIRRLESIGVGAISVAGADVPGSRDLPRLVARHAPGKGRYVAIELGKEP